jgi:hypothetical protein
MPTLTVVIAENEKKALEDLAQKELRDPRAQMLFILRNELARLGYIDPVQLSSQKLQPINNNGLVVS